MTDKHNNNAPAVPEQELSALLTTSLPYMTPVGRARLGQDIAQLYSSVSAPAVPQGEPTEEMLTAGLRECEPLGELIDWREGFGRSEMRAVWSAMLAATPAPAPAQDEPLGHFRAEPFGWTDCAKDDEGAIALYERPQEVGLTDEERADMACAVAAICTGTSSRTIAATAIDWTERALRAKGGK